MRAEQVPERLASIPCPDLGDPPVVGGRRLGSRRVALISTAGLMHQGDRPFSLGSADYRILDMEDSRPLLMSHISTNFDRSGFAADMNVVFPLDVLKARASAGDIGSVARFHYSFMGATDPEQMRGAAAHLSEVLRADEVDLALLVPV
jgi:D-proline reductase (dithiol) PrdB